MSTSKGKRCGNCGRFYNFHDAKCHWCGTWDNEEGSHVTGSQNTGKVKA